MSNPPTRAPQRAPARGQNILLTTKLHAPRPLPGFVPRPRLVDQLDEGLERRLILICAPAGFGKTALLADWTHRGRRSVAWLSLDAGDNDPTRFWRHAVAAVDRIRPGIADRVAPLLGPPPPPSFEGLVTALINELVAQPDEDDALLVLDDYHLIEAHSVHSSLTFLLEHLPPGMHLVVTSRADPMLPLPRLRARGQLTELRAADLRFAAEEATALLREAAGLDLPDAAAAALADRTEGWAAGLQLAALSLRGHPDVAGFLATFSGSHRYVLDYLTEEVLERQPEQVRSFLLETSVLERLSGQLCDAVTGRSDGQARLEAIERANLFLVPLDEVRGWWRYHHLFADLLRARLQQQLPDRVPELHRAAADWSEEHGLADDAIRHALGAGDEVSAARLLERHVDELIFRSEGATLQRWLGALPDELVGSRPRLLLARARVALLGGDLKAAEDPLDAAERSFADAPDESYEPSVGRGASLSANVPAVMALDRAFLAGLRGDAEASTEFTSRALAEIREGEWMLDSLAQWHLAVAKWLQGRLPEAERAFASSLDQWSGTGEATLASWASHHLGLIQRGQGRLEAALETYHGALEFVGGPGRPRLPSAGLAYVGVAEVAYQRDELDTALQEVTEGTALCRDLADTQSKSVALSVGLATLAWIRQAGGDAAGALDAMAEAEQVGPGAGVTNLFNPIPAQRARLLLAQGDVAEAARWTKERGLAAADELSYAQEAEYLVLARVLVAQDFPAQALPLLERLLGAAEAQGRTGSVIEIQALRALALAAGDDESGAVAALSEALRLDCPQSYIRVFADEGAPMGSLLGRLVAAQRTEETARAIPLAFLGRLVRAFEHEAAFASRRGAPHESPSVAVVSGLVENLSGRELEGLQLLAAGKQNREIAEELWVALNTVKKHVTHILEKLGAANRTEATARAHELGLLPTPDEQPGADASTPTTSR